MPMKEKTLLSPNNLHSHESATSIVDFIIFKDKNNEYQVILFYKLWFQVEFYEYINSLFHL